MKATHQHQEHDHTIPPDIPRVFGQTLNNNIPAVYYLLSV